MERSPAEGLTEATYTLHGWSQIAAYLGVSIQTARRRHRRWGLPVVRCVGRRVFTTKGVIDAWIRRLDAAQRMVKDI